MSFYLIKKMEVLTYTSYKEHYDLYTKIHGSIAAKSCQIELPPKKHHFTIRDLHSDL